MNHWIVIPIVLPALLAPFIIMVIRHHLGLQRVFSIAGTLALTLISIGLMLRASSGQIEVYELGNWPAPFGIVLVLDQLSGLMIVLTMLLALSVLLFAVGSGWDNKGKHFHAMFQFQIMGIMGAFLTGDAFNLFVFFEILLIASYGLMIHGGGETRLRAGVQYVVYNLLGSTLFLFALGTLYAVTGTLNMADLAIRVAELPVEDTALLRVGAVLLFLVFAVKAAILPLHFWLPGSYSNAPAPVSALFAIMTKVGAYAIIRMYTLVFGPDLEIANGLFEVWLMPAALLTLTVGTIGVLGSTQIQRLVSFAAIGSMGTLMIAIAMFSEPAMTAALYYVIHSTFATGALFLIADLITERRVGSNGEICIARPMKQNGLIASLYFAGAIAMVGMPPMSGFVGKLMVLDAARGSDNVGLIWSVILITSLIAIIGFARAGSIIFWKGSPANVLQTDDNDQPTPTAVLSVISIVGLLTLLVLLTVLAGPISNYLTSTSGQLFDPDLYIGAVLKRE